MAYMYNRSGLQNKELNGSGLQTRDLKGLRLLTSWGCKQLPVYCQEPLRNGILMQSSLRALNELGALKMHEKCIDVS